MAFTAETENDTEVAAAYLTSRLVEGRNAGTEALEDSIEELDGFYTLCVGTADGFAVLRDPIACKPAVLAETDDWVAMASEYRALVGLPGVEKAKVWEPAPATVYSWGRTRCNEPVLLRISKPWTSPTSDLTAINQRLQRT